MTKKDQESKEKSASTVVDVMSPYFISGSDNPNIVFTSELLRDGNYADCPPSMQRINLVLSMGQFLFRMKARRNGTYGNGATP